MQKPGTIEAMYRGRVEEGLSQRELDSARLGFSQLLRAKRFPPEFVANHSADLLATAQLEYSRRIAEGVEIHNPPGWIVNCAWRRTKSMLEAQENRPRLVSTERIVSLSDCHADTPEDEVLSEDRSRRVRDAVEQLTEDERKLIELAYFEQMSVREAARVLRWHPSKAQRCHRSARKRLQNLLGIKSVDDLQIEIGLAAWLSLADGRTIHVHVPAGIEAAAEHAGTGAAHVWTRAHEFARRLLLGGGGEPASAVAAGSVGRAAGVCGAAAVACLASGVVGPGVGVDLIASKPQAHPAQVRSTPPVRQPTTLASPVETEAPVTPASASSGKFATSPGGSKGSTATKEATTSSSPSQRAEEEFSPFGDEGGTANPALSPSRPGRTAETSPSESSSGGTKSASSPSAARQTSQEFSPFD